jgi:hypothetical protein
VQVFARVLAGQVRQRLGQEGAEIGVLVDQVGGDQDLDVGMGDDEGRPR